MAKEGEPFGRHAMLADPDLHRIARNEANRDERQEHQREKRGNRQREAAEKITKHGRVRGVGLCGKAAEPEPALLDVDAFERMGAERALFVARYVGPGRL